MADDQFIHSPTNPHFFQPLLPGFHTHLKIPVAFFLKHVQESNDHIKTAKLKTDVSAKTWLVKINGLKFTDGWKEFAVAHELRIGDIIIFRHEGDMVFYVTVFGPSFCDIQYTFTSSHNINEDSDNQINDTENSSREKRKRVKKTPRTTKKDSSSDHSHFMARVSSCSLRFDRLYVPISFSRSNGLDNMSGKEIVLLNEEGRSWNLNITTYTKATMQTFVGPGWRRFCAENGMSQGHQYSVKLVRKSAPPVIRLSVGEPAPESSLHPSYYVGSVSSNNLRRNKLYLQRKFVNANGLKGFSEIILKNERGGTWSLGLRYYESLDHTYLGPGWKTFCQVNGIKAGDSFMLKVVETEDKPVLLLCSPNRGKTPLEFPEDSDDVNSLSSDTSSGDDSREESQESEEESLGDEGSSQESFEMEKRKSSSRCGASSSYSQDRFVKLTLTPRALQTYQLALPLGFTRVNGINKPGKITLLDKDGVKKQVVDLLQKSTNDRIMRLGQGWREFCNTHGVKVGQSFVLELIWDDEEAIPVLKFCTKLPQPAPECSIQHSYHVGSVSSNSLRTDKLYLKRKFVTANGLEGFSEVTLKNERGGTWSLGLRYYESLDHTYLRQGWKTFCQANGIKAEDSIMLKLVETGDKPVLLCTSNRGKTKCSEDSDDVNSLSSSYSQDRFVKLTLTPRALKTYKLMLPLGFTRGNGINKPGKITLLDKDGVKKQVVDLLDQNRNTGIMRLGQGWREFCDGHGVKVGESFVLELIWEDDEAIPVLKFCTKL